VLGIVNARRRAAMKMLTALVCLGVALRLP